MHKFTLILEHRLKHRLPESSDRRRLRLDLCEVFGMGDKKNKITLLNQRCKSGKEPTYSQMQAMYKVLAKYGISRDEIFDKEEE